MTDIEAKLIREQPRFRGIKKFKRIITAEACDLCDEADDLDKLQTAMANIVDFRQGEKVFCSEYLSKAVIEHIIHNGGAPVFIDISSDNLCMDPEVLGMAFERYPKTRLVIMDHFYKDEGYSCDIRKICDDHNALLIEASFGDCLKKDELAVYEYIADSIEDSGLAYLLPPCLVCDSGVMFDPDESEHGSASPKEIKDALEAFGVKAAAVSQPLHLCPEYADLEQISLDGSSKEWGYGDESIWERNDESRNLYENGIILPPDTSLTNEELDCITDIIYATFNAPDYDREMWTERA